MSPQHEMEAQSKAYRQIAHVGGRGYGKTARAQAYIQSQSGELVPISVVDTGFSIGPVSVEDGKLLASNYGAGMTFETEYALSAEALKNMLHSMSFRRGVLGEFSMDYTPAEELRDRLNDRLEGKEPLAAINTRYWRNL